MVEVPVEAGDSGIQLNGISSAETEQFCAVVATLENYSRKLVQSFDLSTKQVNQKLVEMSDIAKKALNLAETARNEISSSVSNSFQELDMIITEAEAIANDFECLDRIQAEILRLSDILTTVESTVGRSQSQ